MKPNSLLLEYISDEALALLQEHTNVQVADTPSSGIDIASKMPIAAIVTRGKGDVNEQLIKACQGLQIIARCGVGLDNVNIEIASRQVVKVVNAPGSNADTVAEHTMTLMLALQRQVYTYAVAAKNNNWADRSQFSGDEIRGKTLGILGLGNIGKKVAYLASAFGMKVQYWNRSAQDVEYTKVDFDTLMETSDILSLHLPAVPDTHQLIDAAALQKMKPTASIINTARGTIIDETALTQALQQHRISGFAADVLATEPPIVDHPLLQLPHVLITPHTASLTATTFNQMCVMTVQNVVDILAGKVIDERYIYNRLDL